MSEQGVESMELRERAVYRLPNGRELVARVSRGRTIVLYNLDSSDPRQYQVDEQGRLLLNGRLTAWATADLREEGRTVPPEVIASLSRSLDADQDLA
jgi:hypothetical protein